MKKAILPLLLTAAACSSGEEAPLPEPSWSENFRSYCDRNNPNWLMAVVSRIDRALPEEFVQGSASFEGLNVQTAFAGRAGAKELQLRLTALRDGAPVQLSAYAVLEEGKCDPGDFEVIEGFDRFDPPLRFSA